MEFQQTTVRRQMPASPISINSLRYVQAYSPADFGTMIRQMRAVSGIQVRVLAGIIDSIVSICRRLQEITGNCGRLPAFAGECF